MPRNQYEPLKLNQTNRYAGYQFHARVRIDGLSPSDAFRYLILTVCSWARQRMPEGDRNVPELSLPEAEEYASVGPERFMPYHFSIGYALDITPLMDQGIWSMRLKEPDIGTDERPSVPGRFFTTRVGLRLNEKGYTELGIRIDVTDPASAEKEVAFAFRPAFVRSLAIQPSVVFEQVREMKYGQAVTVETDEDYRQFLYMLENEENQLPLVVFTHFRPGEKKPVSMSMEDFVKNDPLGSFLQSPGMGFGMPGKKEILMPDRASVSGMPAFRPGVVVTADRKARTSAPAPAAPVAAAEPPVMPYDAESFSRSAFAYALTYVLGDRYLEKFRGKVRKEFSPGDILVCGARKFRGAATVIDWPGTGEEAQRKAYSAALLAAQSWSKHKALYDYGTVVFEAEARKMEQHARVMELISSGSMEDRDRIARMTYEMQLLLNVIDDKDEDIEELKRQKEEAFERGQEFAEAEYAALDEENAGLRKELADEQEKNRQMMGEYQRAKGVLGALDRIRKVEKLPADNADVVRYFEQVYPDRLGFTDRGASEASSCSLRTEHLWEILYMVANGMADLFRSVQGNVTEEDVTRVAGCEMSFKEGSMTRKDSTLMRLRDDEYEGKAISVEPHLKLKSVKGEPEHQRLHFCYDPELKKIIIGYFGDHLDSAATQYAKKR